MYIFQDKIFKFVPYKQFRVVNCNYVLGFLFYVVATVRLKGLVDTISGYKC